MDPVAPEASPMHSTYATFWRRFAAFIIDTTIIHSLMMPFVFMYLKSSGFWAMILLAQKARESGMSLGLGDSSLLLGTLFNGFFNTICILIGARTVFDLLYHGIWESSKYQASPGKMACCMLVVDENGQRLTLLRSCTRNFMKLLSNCTFLIGYLVAFVTERHQALHDKISKCYVLKTSYEIPTIQGTEYAGFLRRALAFCLDFLLLVLLVSPLNIFLNAGDKSWSEIVLNNIFHPEHPLFPDITQLIHESWLSIATSFIIFFYFASWESSRLQATPGKIAIGIRVTDAFGQRLTFWKAAGRFAGKYVSQATILIGYIMAGFTPKQQALHDELADTLVIKSQVPKNDI